MKIEQQKVWLNILPHWPNVEMLLLSLDIFEGIEGIETKLEDKQRPLYSIWIHYKFVLRSSSSIHLQILKIKIMNKVLLKIFFSENAICLVFTCRTIFCIKADEKIKISESHHQRIELKRSNSFIISFG